VKIQRNLPLGGANHHLPNKSFKMKVVALFFSSFITAAFAAPAIVWSNDKQASDSVAHSSKSINASSLLRDLLGQDSHDTSLDAAVFLIGRGQDGSESLTTLASSGSLPLVFSKYDEATVIHSHVAGIESPFSVVRDAGAGRRALQVSLSEFSSKLTSLGQTPLETKELDENGMMNKAAKHTNQRARALSEASVTEPSVIDEAVAQAIEHKSVGSVVLAGIRSTDEVKQERMNESKRRIKLMENAGKSSLGSRRLADQNNNDDQNGNSNNGDDMTGVYYVYMTPNIFAGILFTIFFAWITWIGISCMGMIAGQDVYVKKMPTIGREA
jgi:hypothetical protein